MESFTIFTSSTIFDHIIILLSATRLCKMTGYNLQLHLRYRNSFEIQKQKQNIVHAQKCFTLPVSFTGSYTEDQPNFRRQSNLILQKKVSGVDKVVNFKDFSGPNTKIKYFSRTQTEFKEFFQTTSKIQGLFKIVRTMHHGQEQ